MLWRALKVLQKKVPVQKGKLVPSQFSVILKSLNSQFHYPNFIFHFGALGKFLKFKRRDKALQKDDDMVSLSH
jgi:hypothetical protein